MTAASSLDRRQLVLPVTSTIFAAHCLNKTVTQRKRCIGGVVAGPHTPSGIGCRFFDESLGSVDISRHSGFRRNDELEVSEIALYLKCQQNLTLSQHDSAIVTGAFSFTGRYVARHVLDQGVSVGTLTNHPNRPNLFDGQVRTASLIFSDPQALRVLWKERVFSTRPTG